MSIAFDLASGAPWPEAPADAVVATDLLERLPIEDVPWVVDELFAHARRLVLAVVDVGGARRLPPGTARWRRVMAAAGGRHPKLAWRLDVRRRRLIHGWETVSFGSRPDDADAGAPPRVWTLLGEREGDNAQIRALAEALGWPAEAKRLTFTRRYKLWNLLLGASLLSLDRGHSAALGPPWPDLVIAAGRRSAPVARWIREQSGGPEPAGAYRAAVGAARLLRPGRHDAAVRAAAAAQRPAQHAADRPLERRPPGRGRGALGPRLAALPRPLVALLVGGDSPPYVLDPGTAERLGREAADCAHALGGTLLVTCGPRVRAPASEALAVAARGPGHFHRWRPDDPDNPYLAYLALADRFIVTGDSASMLAEACATGKPVSIFPLPERADWRWRTTRRVQRWVERRQARRSVRGTVRQQDWIGRLWDRLVELGLIKRMRDLTRVHRVVEARGEGAGAPDDLERAVARVRQLVRERPI